MGDTESSIDTQKLMRQALAECIAVFIFVFSGCLCALAARMCLGDALNKSFVGMVATNPGAGIEPVSAMCIEIFTTFSLVFTVMMVAVDKNHDMGPYCAIPIGFAVVMGILASGHLSGGSMNPARSFGPALAGSLGEHTGDGLSNLWVYFLGPLLGASIAGLAWQFGFAERKTDV